MSEELKVQIPDGYRWVEVGEERNGAEWRVVWCGMWWELTTSRKCEKPFNVITPINPQEPEYMDVVIEALDNRILVFTNPINGVVETVTNAPCIVGPEWAFARYVWDSPIHSGQSYYKVYEIGAVEYAKAVRFRWVGEVK